MKSKYIAASHSFQEQQYLERPIAPKIEDYPMGHETYFNQDWYNFNGNLEIYNDHVKSLRLIPCRPGDKWQEGFLYEEHLDYTVYEYSDENRIHRIEIVPVNTDDEDIYDAVRRKRNQMDTPAPPPTTEQTELNKCLSLLKEILTDVGGVTNCSKIHNACVAFRNAGGAYKLSINPQERAIANDTSSEQTELWKEAFSVANISNLHNAEIAELNRKYSITRKQEVPEAVSFAEWIAQKHYYKDVHKEWYGCERGMTVLIAKTTAELYAEFQLFKRS